MEKEKFVTAKHQCPACLFTHKYAELEKGDEIICTKCASVNIANEDQTLRVITQAELDRMEPDYLFELIRDQDEIAKKIRPKKTTPEFISEDHKENAEAEKNKMSFSWQTVLKDKTRYRDVLDLLIEIKKQGAYVSIEEWQSTLIFRSKDPNHLDVIKKELLFHKLILEL